MLKNMAETEGTHDVTTWHTRVACWIGKATCTYAHAHAHAPGYRRANTHAHAWTHRPFSTTYCFSTVTVTRDGASVLCYAYIAYLVSNKYNGCALAETWLCMSHPKKKCIWNSTKYIWSWFDDVWGNVGRRSRTLNFGTKWTWVLFHRVESPLLPTHKETLHIKTKAYTGWFTKKDIFSRRKNIFHCDRTFRTNMYLVLNGYWDKLFEYTNTKAL
jgi:hypothetical protein